MQQLMKQAQKMQQQLEAAQAELADAEVTGSAGGGLVTATVTGSGELIALTIDPTAVDPDDIETLQDLVVAAVRDANRAADELGDEKMGPLAGAAARRPGPARPLTSGSTRCTKARSRTSSTSSAGCPASGPKSAQRIAFHLLAADPVDVERLAATLLRVKDEVRFCAICGNVAEAEECRICRDPRRDLTRHLRRRGAQGRRRDRDAPASSAAATTCSAARSARSTASARTTCGSASC